MLDEQREGIQAECCYACSLIIYACGQGTKAALSPLHGLRLSSYASAAGNSITHVLVPNYVAENNAHAVIGTCSQRLCSIAGVLAFGGDWVAHVALLAISPGELHLSLRSQHNPTTHDSVGTIRAL